MTTPPLSRKNAMRTQKQMIPEPTETSFTIQGERFPHGFSQMSERDHSWFVSMVNSDIRFYYRTIRSGTVVAVDNPIGRSGITVGELAVYIIRANHTKRRRRY